MLSFSPEYGPKLKEESVMVKHLAKIIKDDDSRKCCSNCFNFCNDNWQKVINILLKLVTMLHLSWFLLIHEKAKYLYVWQLSTA